MASTQEKENASNDAIAVDTQAIFDEESGGVDLAGGDLSPDQRQSVNLATEAWHFQRSQQGSVFSIVAAIAVLLYMVAGIFGAAVLYKSANGTALDWHTWLISVSFLLPPTILCVALVRAVYPKDRGNKESDDALKSVPAADFLRELARTVRE